MLTAEFEEESGGAESVLCAWVAELIPAVDRLHCRRQGYGAYAIICGARGLTQCLAAKTPALQVKEDPQDEPFVALSGPLFGLVLLLLVLKIRCGFTFGCCAKHTTSL
jgi:hypothetical protein